MQHSLKELPLLVPTSSHPFSRELIHTSLSPLHPAALLKLTSEALTKLKSKFAILILLNL